MLPTVSLRSPGWVAEFKAFLMRGNVVDLAVGVVIGAAFTGVVNSLVKDVFNPLLGLALGGVDFSNRFVPLNGQHYDTLADAQRANAATLNYGLFVNAIIQFLIIAFVIFWVVKAMNRMMRREDPAAEVPAPTVDQVLLTEIRDSLRGAPPPVAAATGRGANPRCAARRCCC